MNKNHNTIQNYIFIGNTETNGNLSELKNVKYIIGKLAYDIHGNELDKNYILPLFIHKDSYNQYNNIMQAELNKIRNG